MTPAGGDVVINEVAAAGDPVDWFELVNPGDATVDLSTWSFSDDVEGTPQKAFFEAGTTIAPGEYLVIEVSDEWPGFKLGGDEELGVFDGDGLLVDATDWDEGGSPDGGSWGRLPDGTGAFQTLTLPTPGAANMMATGGVCGDGTLDDGEACDDGNTSDGDGCASDCTIEVSDPVCGNHVVEGDEQCDDGNNVDGDGCDRSCRIEAPAACGDGSVGGGEACDDGGNEAGDGCAPDCTVETGWACDAGPCAPICGDGMYVGDETCDDTDGVDGNGCSASCVLEAGATVIVINEVVADSDTTEDWVELHNPNTFGVLLSGWSMTDDTGLPADDPERPFVIADMQLAAGGFVSFERNAPDGFLYGLARGGDTVTLFDPTGAVADETTWGDGDADAPASWGRVPDGTGDFATLDTPSRDASNGT